MWEPHDPVSFFAHILFGFIALSGGVFALLSKKGSAIHKWSGRLFAGLMLMPVVITTFVFMRHNSQPLVIVTTLATIYLIISAFVSLRNTHPQARLIEYCILIIPIVIGLFAAAQTIRFLMSSNQGPLIGPLLIASIFCALAIGDIRVMVKRPVKKTIWVKRHLLRMLLAFAFATMAVLRIGVQVGLPFEATVIVPLLLALLAAWYFNRKIDHRNLTFNAIQDLP